MGTKMKVWKCRNGLWHPDVASLTEKFGHEGTSRGDVKMKKSLLATVATVALIAGTSLVSAQSANQQAARDRLHRQAGRAGT